MRSYDFVLWKHVVQRNSFLRGPVPENDSNQNSSWRSKREDAIGATLAVAFNDGELERWWLDNEGGFGLTWREHQPDELWLHVVACEERFDFRILSPDDGSGRESLECFEDRLRNDLGDWIAESRFGWGQQRLK